MTVFEAIQGRKSIRKYQDKPVEQEKLEQILQAGQLAPSAKNEQNWKFMVVTDPELRKSLVHACQGQSFVGEAPVSIVVCVNNVRNLMCGQPARTIDGAIALTHMMLEAHELGLGTCWLGRFDSQEAREILKVPEEYEIVAITPLGYPAADGVPRNRKPLEEMVVYDNKWQ